MKDTGAGAAATAATPTLAQQLLQQGYDIKLLNDPAHPADAVGAYKEGVLSAIIWGDEARLDSNPEN